MFKFLKDKLKKAVGRFSKDVEEEVKEARVEKPETVEEKTEERTGKKPAVEDKKPEPVGAKPEIKAVRPVPEAKPEPKPVAKAGPEPVLETAPELIKEPEQKPGSVAEKPKRFLGIFKKKPVEAKPEEKKGIFSKVSDIVTKKSISESRFNDLFWELEMVMLENNMAMEVIEKIKEDLRQHLVNQKFDRSKVSDIVSDTLKETISNILDYEKIDLITQVKNKQEKPYVIAFFGVNGAGKTTNLVKVAKFLESNGLSTVIAACDTFRAAAIQQLEEHAKNIGVKVIKHDYGSDAAAVAFDTIRHAKAKNKDVVLIDTAGRQHSNTNLMDELKKLVRVNKPDLKVFVGESITGNDCIEQAKNFNGAVDVDAIILTKADIDEKGGAAVSISYVIKKPILFFGIGQGYGDIREFDKDFVMQNIGLA